ncbi:2596_t:CDS:1, partial [Ambispora gerdemannii]
MAKIHSWYLSNITKELQYYNKKLSLKDLFQSALEQTVFSTLENSQDSTEEDINFVSHNLSIVTNSS